MFTPQTRIQTVARAVAGLTLCWAGIAHAEDRILKPGPNVIKESTTIAPRVYPLPDANGGAVHITGNGIVVDFQGATLRGAEADAPPDRLTGTAIRVSGNDVTVRNVVIRGYKVGIRAEKCPDLRIERVRLHDNYRQRLASTPDAEDTSDWLYPHENDDGQWVEQHGAGVHVADSTRVTLRDIEVRTGQNGIILERVTDSSIHDNDCSFLSGWGLGLWRCQRNTISRNAFDFCVRGYSHGIYNRGQDSAGILMFEQNNENVIAENSATHCGDGLFGFGGRASLAGTGRTGNNANLIIENDFSHAAAHGIEMTFSFDNRIVGNRLVGNAICGIWGGYSQHTLIAGNIFESNGRAGYGRERGGINIEHGSGNLIHGNIFTENACGVHLWWDEDAGLAGMPWVQANEKGSTGNVIADNIFDRDDVAIELRRTGGAVLAGNVFRNVGNEIARDDSSDVARPDDPPPAPQVPTHPVHGENRPIGARRSLGGRESIIMTEWGPYAFDRVALVPEALHGGDRATFRVLGPGEQFEIGDVPDGVEVSPLEGATPGTVQVAAAAGGVRRFDLNVRVGDRTLTLPCVLTKAEWNVAFHDWTDRPDPREDIAAWNALISGEPAHATRASSIEFDWKMRPPAEGLNADRFGTVATTSLVMPKGRWRVITVSDDGIRVWIDGQLCIDDWTWHAPKRNEATVELAEGDHAIRIEHFEIDGYAALKLRLQPDR